MRRDDRIVILGEDVGRRGGVFRVTAGLLEEFGEDRVHRLAACRVGHHRQRDRDGGQRPAPDRRDPVPRLHPSGDGPDHERGGADPLPLQQRFRLPDRDPGAVRRRRPRRALPLAEHRGASSSTRQDSRSSRPPTPADAKGLLRPRSATTTRSSSSSTRRCTARSRARSRTGTTRSRSARRGSSRKAPTRRSSPTA